MRGMVSFTIWALFAALLSVSVASRSFEDQKTYYLTPPTGTPPSHTPDPSTPSYTPPINCDPSTPPPYTPTPRTPTPKTPTPKTPTPKTPTPKTPTPKTPSPKTPSPKTPSPKTPSPKTPSPKTPTPKTPSDPKTPSYSPPCNCGTPPTHTPTPSHPSPPHRSPPSGGYYSPPSTPVVVTPPTPIDPGTPIGGSPPIDPGTPGTPFVPAPFPPFTGTCDYWRNHPTLIFGLIGWWGTIGGAFGPVSTSSIIPGFDPHMNLLQALSNPRTDAIGSLYREGTASWLNSMVNNRFPFTTPQVRDHFVAGLSSTKAATRQAHTFKLANEGHLKPRV